MPRVCEKRWIVPEPDTELVDRLRREASCSPVVAALLARRGVRSASEVERFLSPKLGDLSEPWDLPDMGRAVDRILAAMRSDEPIAIFGDYDVDGVSSTCLLLDFFRLIDVPVRWRLPDRLREGYGLREGIVRELAEQGVRLLITVDNGSSSRAEVELARSLGIDVVVTDHHQPPDEPVGAVAHVNPKLLPPGDGGAGPFRELAGVGVAFKLAWALSERLSRAKKVSPEFRQFLLDALALVALGTIADVVPLRDENRVLAKFGLSALETSPRPGLRKLVESASRFRDQGHRLTSRDVGFGLGPRINAVGRMGQAELAVRLLLAEEEVEAGRLLDVIEAENRRRRDVESAIHEQARARVLADVDLEREPVIVLGEPEWHSGVLGIVAARLVDEFWRPALLVNLDGPRSRGSARSIPGVNITEALASCRSCLAGYGGHELAAGVSMDASRIEDLRRSLGEVIELSPGDMVPEVTADCRVALRDIDAALMGELERLGPWGEGNPEPLLAADGLDVVGTPRTMGQDGRHLSFHVRQNGRSLRAVAFGKGNMVERLTARQESVSLLFRPVRNTFRGRQDIELHVQELRVGAEG